MWFPRAKYAKKAGIDRRVTNNSGEKAEVRRGDRRLRFDSKVFVRSERAELWLLSDERGEVTDGRGVEELSQWTGDGAFVFETIR